MINKTLTRFIIYNKEYKKTIYKLNYDGEGEHPVVNQSNHEPGSQHPDLDVGSTCFSYVLVAQTEQSKSKENFCNPSHVVEDAGGQDGGGGGGQMVDGHGDGVSGGGSATVQSR